MLRAVEEKPPVRTIERSRYAALDGLRGLAAYAVVVSHFAELNTSLEMPFYQAGRIGVMIFFVLSGFLMGKIYLPLSFSRETVMTFCVHRVARVVPLFYGVVFVAYALFLVKGNGFPLYAVTNDTVLYHLFFVWGSSALWTIPPEIQFYALFPLLWLTFARAGIGALVVACALIIGVLAFIKFPQSPVILTVLPYFLIGVLAARIPMERSAVLDVLWLVSMALLVVSLPAVRGPLGFPNAAGWESVLHMAVTFSVLLAAAYSPLAQIALGNKFAAFFGTISYSVYLLHLPVFWFLSGYNLLPPNVAAAWLAYLLAVTAVASITYYLFEAPAQRLVRSWRPQPRGNHVPIRP